MKQKFLRKNKNQVKAVLLGLCALFFLPKESDAQITLLNDYQNNYSKPIGTFQGINFRESGFSGMYAIPGTGGKEFWIISDRGVNVDCINANPAGCHPTYDKMYAFPGYAPKIHRIRVNGDSIQILQTISVKRPTGTGATGIINPTGFGSTALEVASTDTVQDCANFNLKIAAKDIWGVDPEGITVDKDGNFWICEEGGPTIWKLNPNGVVIKRYTPYANLVGAESIDVPIDTVFKYRKNNRGFESIAITPNGKIYAIIQSPILYPDALTGNATQVHRILEIDPVTNDTRMFVYLNDGTIGAPGPNQIRMSDWKVGDMSPINDSTFLVIEAALRGASDYKLVYLINISQATEVHSGLYSGLTLEGLVGAAGLAANGITPVSKTMFLDLLANGWPAVLDKSEGITIINDSTIAVGNDNDYGQTCPAADGIPIATGNVGHIFIYGLQGANKVPDLQLSTPLLSQGTTGPSTSVSPYLVTTVPGLNFTSIGTANETYNGYKLPGTPDGLGAFDNGNGTFTLLMNHEFGNTAGIPRAHGSKGAFVSKWIINKNDLSVVNISDQIQTVKLWNGINYATVAPSSLTEFNRFCSADLPPVSAFYNAATGLGTQERIFMNGEESGNEGRAFGHIVTGPEAGTSYELPYLGKFSWENSVACPKQQDNTVVIGLDDTTPGQVYAYIGAKTNTGNEIEKAGLSNGKLYGIKVTGMMLESNGSLPTDNTAFTLFDLGFVQNTSGADINTASDNAGVTKFLRPEDGAWDPSNPSDFYFVTTNAFNSPSRLWRLRFTDIANPQLGGTISALMDGTEGQQMLDNITLDNYGHVLMVEDVGNNAHLGKTWQYTIATDSAKIIATHDQTRFLNGAANFLTQDEEASGIMDAQEILGQGWFLVDDQAHQAIPGEVVENGQLLAFFNPDTYNNPEITVAGNSVEITDGNIAVSAADNTDFGNVYPGSSTTKLFKVKNTGHQNLLVTAVNFTGINAADFNLATAPVFPLTIAAGDSLAIGVQFAPAGINSRYATIEILNNDYNEDNFDFALRGTGACDPTGSFITAQACNEYIWNGNTYTSSGSYTYTTTNTAGCDSTVMLVLTIVSPCTKAPKKPAITVSGTSLSSGATNKFCPGDMITVSVTPDPYACEYFWTAPAGGTVVSGQGTPTATIVLDNAFAANGSVSVYAHNTCGQSGVATKPVNRGSNIYKPGAIAQSGLAKICPGETRVFSIDPIAGISNYVWTNPAGTNLLSGQGTESIELEFTAGFNTTSPVQVVTENACGLSKITKKNAAFGTKPAVPSVITGNNIGVCGATNLSYSVTGIPGLIYNWSFDTPQATVSSGQGTSNITADFTTAFTAGALSVTAANGCGVSSSRKLGSIKAIPATPAVPVGPANVCFNQPNVTYSIPAVQGASAYTWTAPAQAIISDGVNTSITNTLTTGSNAVTVNFGVKKGSIKVVVHNACGSSGAKTLSVNVTNCALPKMEAGEENIRLFPNPANDKLNVLFYLPAGQAGAGKACSYTIRVYDALGKEVLQQEGNATEGSNQTELNVSNLAAGVYQFIIKNEGMNNEGLNYKARFVVE